MGHERGAAHLDASAAVVARAAVATAVADGGGSCGSGCGGGSVSSDGCCCCGGDAQGCRLRAAGGGGRAGGARRRRPRGHLQARERGEGQAARGRSSSPPRGRWGGGTAGGPLACSAPKASMPPDEKLAPGAAPWRQPTARGPPETPPAIRRRGAEARRVRESGMREKASAAAPDTPRATSAGHGKSHTGRAWLA